MARDSANERNGDLSAADSRNGGRNTLLNRRSYLKLAGSAAIATAAAKTAGAANDYDIVEVAAGDTHSVRLGDGDRLENVLIDITAQGAGYDIQAVGDDWVIQNVGIRGAWDHSPRASPFRVAVESADASARIENLYLGDGVAGSFSPNAEPTGLYAYWYHAGTLEIRNVNVQGFSDNGMYLSAPGNSNAHPNPGHGGEIHIYDSYAKDNQVSGFRLGTDGSFCKNCVAVGGSHRGFWGYYGKTELIDCDLLGNSSADIKLGTGPWDKSKLAEVTVTDTRFESVAKSSSNNKVNGSSAGTPEDRIPEGVPTSPEEAAAGTGSSAADPSSETDDQLENTILVDGVGASGTSRYEFTVSGAAEKATDEGASIDDGDTIDSGQVTGAVGGWRDAFRFSGDLEELTVDGSARVSVNGERVDPTEYGAERSHVLTIVGNGTPSNYEISVDGTIETVAGDDSEQYATVASENTVEGSIERGAQRFEFSGALTDVTFLEGSAHVYLDDERIDPDEYGEELLPHALVIDGSDVDGETTYSFTVDGEVITSSYRDASIDAGDEIDGRTVSGSVDDWVDAYWFDGDVVDFRLNGDANVDVEYDAHGR